MRPWIALAIVTLLAGLAYLRSQPLAPRGLDAPEAEFSAARARQTLEAIAGDGAPHPVGTEAHERVREVVTARLTELGYDVEPISRFVCGRISCADVTDLLVRIPGRVSGNAVVLTAHFDSVAAGPGASDDGVGVAVILEAARALEAAPALRRPVWLLVTDGEELGLLGAKALVMNPILTGQIGVVVNVEARGTSGPSLMFETSAKNAGLVRAFARSTSHPVASSLFPTIYSMLPNDTDLSVYKGLGLSGLNYAVVGGAARYHTPRDDVAHADLGSLQHQGDNALAMVRALAEGANSTVAEDDLVFFDCLGAFVVRWPARAALPVALAILLAIVASAVVSARRRLVTTRAIGLGALGLLAAPAGALAGLALSSALGAAGATPAAWIAHPRPMLLASVGLGVLVAAAAATLALHRASAEGLWWGAGLALALLGVVASRLLPGVSFLFVAPAAGVAVGTCAWTFGRRAGREDALQRWALLAPACATIAWVPTLGLLYDGLGARWLPALSAGAALVAWTSAPALVGLSRRARTVGMGVLAAGCLVSAAAAALAPPFDADVPAHASVRTYAEGGASRAFLFAPDGAPAALLARFPQRDATWPWSRVDPAGSVALAPTATPPSPELEVTATTKTATGREIAVTLRSARGAAIVGLAVRRGDDVRAVHVEGEAVPAPGPAAHRAEPWASYECLTTWPRGVRVRLSVGSEQPVEVYVYDRVPGLPAGDARALGEARGPESVPYGAGDYSVVARRVTL